MNAYKRNISVVMPVYNCAEYLRYSIKSILNQTYSDFEFIIIDDGSTDKTQEVIKSFNDSRIVCKKTEHKGTSAALNYGVSLASCEWIARIDADDMNTQNRLETQLNFIVSHPEIEILSSWSVYFKNNNITFLVQEPTKHHEIIRYLNLHNPLNQSALLIKKKLLLDYPFDENYLFNEDFELMHRIKDKAIFANVPEFLVFTRIRNDSKSYIQTNKNIFNFLYPETQDKLHHSKLIEDINYWKRVTGWIHLFFGDKSKARKYLLNEFSIKTLAAFIITYLPQAIFNKFINYRWRYRVKSIFINKKYLQNDLNRLLES